MPTGKHIDWSTIDFSNIHNLSLKEFQASYCHGISLSALTAKVRKLGLKPKPYVASKGPAHWKSRVWTKEEDAYLATNADTMGFDHIAQALGVSQGTALRRAKFLGCMPSLLTQKLKHRIANATALNRPERKAHLSKCAKGRRLSEETKQKISEALKGEKNGQYGRGMTEEEKIRWRATYEKTGRLKMLEYLASPAGREARRRSHSKTTTPEFRAACAERSAQLIQDSVLKTNRGHGSWVESVKGGRFYVKSTYEARYVEELEADPEVVSFRYEPFKIPYEFEGTPRSYVPDFEVTAVYGTYLVEVKPQKLWTLPKNVAKINAARAAGHVVIQVSYPPF